MVTYRAYYDASGSETDKTGVVVVYALIASENRWRRFEQGWEELLRGAGLSALHMKSVFADLKRLHPGEDDKAIQTRLDALLDGALAALHPWVRKSFSMSLSLDDYRTMNREYPLAESFGNGYAFAAVACVRRVQEWRRRQRPHAPILHIFEAGDNGQDFLLAAMPKLAKLGYTYAVVPKCDPETDVRVREFEATDYLAWETRRIHHAIAAGQRLRQRAHTVNSVLKFNDLIFNGTALRRVCETLGIPRRDAE